MTRKQRNMNFWQSHIQQANVVKQNSGSDILKKATKDTTEALSPATAATKDERCQEHGGKDALSHIPASEHLLTPVKSQKSSHENKQENYPSGKECILDEQIAGNIKEPNTMSTGLCVISGPNDMATSLDSKAANIEQYGCIAEDENNGTVKLAVDLNNISK